MNKLVFLLSYALLASLSQASAADRLPDKFDPSRDAVTDVAAAVALANASGKRVLVDVGGEWCPWCHVLDRFMAANDDVHRLRDAGYVWVKVNWSPQNRNEQLLSRWPRIKAYPHLFVLDGAGQLVHSQSSNELEAGSNYDHEKMMSFLRRHQAPVQAARPPSTPG